MVVELNASTKVLVDRIMENYGSDIEWTVEELKYDVEWGICDDVLLEEIDYEAALEELRGLK